MVQSGNVLPDLELAPDLLIGEMDMKVAKDSHKLWL